MGIDLTALEHTLKTRTPGLMDARRAYAVLVPLVEKDGELCLLYEVRASTLRRQPGEVCFPGGLMEGSESPEECALRETWEELAIPREQIRLLGRLDFIAHRANFLMQPVLGLVDSGALDRMVPSPAEVEEVFLVPLSHLLNTGCMRKFARWAMKSSRPNSFTPSGEMANSSQVSRRAHSSGVSPGSISPPGKQTSPGWRRSVLARTS